MPITELQGLLYARTEKGASLGLNPIISTTSCRGFKNTLFCCSCTKEAPKIAFLPYFAKVHFCHIARILFNHQPNQPDPKYPRNFSKLAGVFLCSRRTKKALQNAFLLYFAKVHFCHITRILFNHQPNQPDPKYPRNFSKLAGVFLCSRRTKKALQNAFLLYFAKVHFCHITRILFNHQPNQPDPKYPRNFSKLAGVFLCSGRTKKALLSALLLCFEKVHFCHIARILFNHQPNQPDTKYPRNFSRLAGVFLCSRRTKKALPSALLLCNEKLLQPIY